MADSHIEMALHRTILEDRDAMIRALVEKRRALELEVDALQQLIVGGNRMTERSRRVWLGWDTGYDDEQPEIFFAEPERYEDGMDRCWADPFGHVLAFGGWAHVEALLGVRWPDDRRCLREVDIDSGE